MDKVLAFSILSASPADIATGPGAAGAGLSGRWARLSWRSGAGDHAEPANSGQQQQQQKRDREKKRGSSPHRHGGGGGGGKDPAAASLPPRFAPEFDGIDCFETIVSH